MVGPKIESIRNTALLSIILPIAHIRERQLRVGSSRLFTKYVKLMQGSPLANPPPVMVLDWELPNTAGLFSQRLFVAYFSSPVKTSGMPIVHKDLNKEHNRTALENPMSIRNIIVLALVLL